MISEAKFFKAKGKGRIIEDLSNIITAPEKNKTERKWKKRQPERDMIIIQ